MPHLGALPYTSKVGVICLFFSWRAIHGYEEFKSLNTQEFSKVIYE